MRVEFANRCGETIVGDLSSDDGGLCVVLCHGFSAHRRWGVIPVLFECLSARGFSVFSFDFSGCGESEGRFADSTFEKQPLDVRDALDYLEREHGFSRFVLVGHSMGGYAAVKEAETDERVCALVSLAGVVDVERTMARNRERLGKEFSPPRVKGADVVDRDYTIDEGWVAAAERARIGFVRDIPVLAVHGKDDEHVDLEHSHSLKEVGALLVTLDTDHFFMDVKERLCGAVASFLSQL